MNLSSCPYGEPPRVLIVEDDEIQAAIIKSALLAGGVEAQTVGGGLTAIWEVRKRRYDLVLVDYDIPEIDGLATARLIDEYFGNTARPVLIALTANPEALKKRERGGSRAFDAVISKGGDLGQMVAVVKSHLSLAPHPSLVQNAVFSLLLEDWLGYDVSPVRPGLPGVTGPARILLVEDDEIQRALFKSVLERRAYIVDCALDGLEAVRTMRNSHYDVALIDYRLPELDGFAVAHVIQNTSTASHRARLVGLTATPVILREIEDARGKAFDHIIDKSAGTEALLSSLERIMAEAPNPLTRDAARHSAAAALLANTWQGEW